MSKPKLAKTASVIKRKTVLKNGKVITDIVYLIEKYVKTDCIDFKRDTVIAKRLLKSFPEIEFWKGLEVKHLCNTLAIVACPAARSKLKSLYRQFAARRETQAKVTIAKPEIHTFEKHKVGEDRPTAARGPKTVLDFLRKSQ